MPVVKPPPQRLQTDNANTKVQNVGSSTKKSPNTRKKDKSMILQQVEVPKKQYKGLKKEEKLKKQEKLKKEEKPKKGEKPKKKVKKVKTISPEEERFHVRINCYVILVIIASLLLTFTIFFIQKHWDTVKSYSMGWAFLLYYTMCALDIFAGLAGILSSLPAIKLGGCAPCRWIVTKWNKYYQTITDKKEKEISKQSNKVQDTQSLASNQPTVGPPDSTTASLRSSNNSKSTPFSKVFSLTLKPPSISKFIEFGPKNKKSNQDKGFILNEKLSSVKSETERNKNVEKYKEVAGKYGIIGGKKGNDKQTDDKKQTKEFDPPGCLCKGGLKPCTFCVTGYIIETAHFNDWLACLSCIAIHTAMIINLFCTAFYKYMNRWSPAFHEENKKCTKYPESPICSEFLDIFTFLSMFTWIPIVTRLILLVVIGWHTDPTNLDDTRPSIPCKEDEEELDQAGKRKKTPKDDTKNSKPGKPKKKKRHHGEDSSSSSDEDDYNIKLALKQFVHDHKDPLDPSKIRRTIG